MVEREGWRAFPGVEFGDGALSVFERFIPFADAMADGPGAGLVGALPPSFDTHHIFSVDEYYWEDRRATMRFAGSAERR